MVSSERLKGVEEEECCLGDDGLEYRCSRLGHLSGERWENKLVGLVVGYRAQICRCHAHVRVHVVTATAHARHVEVFIAIHTVAPRSPGS